MSSTRSRDAPFIVVLAGPNGAGKSTLAPFLLRDALAVTEFVNADEIARGLAAFNPESVAIAAGRLMLQRLDELARWGVSFGFETTLATRSYAPWLRSRIVDGNRVHLMFLYLASPDLAVERVAGRVARGGHAVPEDVVRRRYVRGLQNLFGLYMPLVTSWDVYDASASGDPILLAYGLGGAAEVRDRGLWGRIVRQWS